MAFWRAEIWSNSSALNPYSKFQGVLCDSQSYRAIREEVKHYLWDIGRDKDCHCEIFKCSGVPLRHGVDGTKRHYLY